jgi:hypothetical protein
MFNLYIEFFNDILPEVAEIELLRVSEMEDTDYVLAQDSPVRREIWLPGGDEEGHTLD